MQPAADRAAPADRRGVARQGEECGLEGVFGIVLVVQHAPADAEDQRAVAAHQRREGCFLAPCGETLQQFAVG